MSWLHYHKLSEQLADQAEVARFKREFTQARHFSRLAAEQEELAFAQLTDAQPRTLGITAVSAVALWYKAGEYAQARAVAHQCLSRNALPAFAVAQLNDLLAEIQRLETLGKDVEEWRVRIPFSPQAREQLQAAVATWKASAA